MRPGYYEVAPASALTSVLEVAADRIAHPLAGVDEADFERERAIVENELNQRNEMGVYGRVVAWMQAAMFPPGIRTRGRSAAARASLRRLTLADARSFVAETLPSVERRSLLVTGESAVTAGAGERGVAPARGGHLPGGDRVARPRSRACRRPRRPALPLRRARLGRLQARPDVLKAAVALPEIWLAYDLGGGGYDSAIAKILTSRAAETIVRERLMPEREVLDVDFFAVGLPGKTVLACQIVLEDDRRRAYDRRQGAGI